MTLSLAKAHAADVRAGFSLVELLIALVIIGIMAIAAAPSLSEVLSDNRQVAAAMDVLRIARVARSIAAGSGVAQLLRFENAGNNGSSGLGKIELFAGMNAKCRQTPWPQAFQVVSGTPRGRSEVLDLVVYNPSDWDPLDGSGTHPAATDTGRQVIQVLASSVAAGGTTTRTAVQICYQPNGETFASYVADTSVALAAQADDILLTVRRSVNGVQHGQNRVVLFRPGALARMQ
jgi:prepilin-type N-terminal cleavage/methylation domain-containing protein